MFHRLAFLWFAVSALLPAHAAAVQSVKLNQQPVIMAWQNGQHPEYLKTAAFKLARLDITVAALDA